MERTALAEAEAADVELAAGTCRGRLHGVPVSVKDLCWTKGYPTSAGMTVHRDFVPAEDATAVRRLRDAGAVILGKLQLTEGAYSDHHPSISPPTNLWDFGYWPGISSSGSGAALAAGLCYGAIGTDTGGSIRWPSAANGITGLKPTWGRVSRHGVFELAATLDHVGTMARSAADAGYMLEVIAGSDPNDPTSLDAPVPNFAAAVDHGAAGLRIGIDPAWNDHDVDAETRGALNDAVRVLTELGAEIQEVALPDPSPMIADWAPNCAVEAAVAHEASFPARRHEYGPVLASVLDAGRALCGMDYQRIILRRMDFRGLLASAMRGVDLLLVPVQPFPPLTLESVRTLGEQPELIAKLQRYTCPFDMTGHPTITLPGGFTNAVGHHLREDVLVRAARLVGSGQSLSLLSKTRLPDRLG